MDRIMGVLTLKAPVYREIAEDANATTPAGIIVAVVALIAGFSQGLYGNQLNFVSAIIAAIATVVFGLIAWFVGSWVLSFVAGWFGGKTNLQEMLRVTGFVEVFGIVAVLYLLAALLPVLGCLAGLVLLIISILRIIGYVIGVREAAEFTTGKAIITAIIAVVIVAIIYAIGATILAAIGIGGAALMGGLSTPQ